MTPMRQSSLRSSRNLERLESRPPEEVIPYLLKSLHHSLRQIVDERLRAERIELSFAHLVILSALADEPGLPGAELARRTYVTAQTINTILHRLEQEGRIERQPHPSSPRADSWFITRRGRTQLDAAKVVGADIWRKMLATIAPREINQLQGLLQRCIVGVDAQLEAAHASAKRRAPRSVARRRAGTRPSARKSGSA